MDYSTASTFRDTMNVSVSDVGQDEADHDDDEDDQDVPHAETDTIHFSLALLLCQLKQLMI